MGRSASEVCVIGGGVVGLASATALIDRGIDVACFEGSEPGQGQSAGRTRQFRHLHQDPELIELAVRARRGWLQWEERLGRTLLGSEGALRVGADAAELAALHSAGVPAVSLDVDAARERLPIASIPADGSELLLWDPLAGAIRAAEAIAAMTAWAGGALHRETVRAIRVKGGSVELDTTAGRHSCERCVVCAGAGTDRLVRPLGIDVHQDRQAHVRLSFRVRSAVSGPLPCFSDRRSAGSEQVYAITDLSDRYAVGLASVTTYPAVADLAAEVPADIDVSSQRARIVAYVRSTLPGVDPEPLGEVLRLTTTLPSHPEDGFEVWAQGPVVAVAGPNLFKFAPVIGERLADAVTETRTARGTPVAPSR